MKKIYMTMLSALFVVATFAQNNVTFKVDLGTATANANGVHVAGSFQAAPWTPGATLMTQVGTTSVYQVTVSIPAGKYEFKFLNGNAWGDDETPGANCGVGNGNGNRWVDVKGTTVLPAVMYGGCAPAGMNSIMMMVDMSTQGTVNDTISAAGSFQGWSPGTTIMTDWFNDSIYRTIAYVNSGDTIAYKFLNGAAWGTDESVPGACAVNNNRQAIATGDIIAGPFCFSQCVSCFIPDTFNVTIRVDLQNVCAAIDSVDIAGPLNGWAGGDMMTNMGNGIWEITVRQPEPSFKFKARYFADGSSSPNWEGGGDKEPIFSSDTILPVRCFGADVYGACVSKPAPATITFRVDFSQSSVTPASNIYLIGDFTQWQTNAILMTPMTTNPGVYETVVPNFCPAEIFYKFVNGDVALPANEENPQPCGVPSGTGGFNRKFVRPDANPHTLQFIFDSCEALVIGVEEDFLQNVVNVTPNPFSTYATIALGEGNYAIRVLDITGRVIREMKNVTGNVTLDRGNMSAGVYFMTVTNAKGEAKTSKFIVE